MVHERNRLALAFGLAVAVLGCAGMIAFPALRHDTADFVHSDLARLLPILTAFAPVFVLAYRRHLEKKNNG